MQEEYINQYEQNLMQQMLRLATSMGLLEGQLLESPDITEKWDQLANSYIADAVKEIAQYPSVSLGWAMYLGMGIARFWDDAWETYSKVGNLYEYIRDRRGFDYMDEVVRGEILHLEGEDFDRMEKHVQAFAKQVLAQIRHEQIEPQSPLAYYIYVRSVTVLYKLGAAIELKTLGYKFEKVD